MERGEPATAGERTLHRNISAPAAAGRATLAGAKSAGLPHAKSANARLERGSSMTPSETGSEKVRKPYTITKQRERWTDAEHALFLEALREHGRAWRRIEEHIGTKTAVQIRSHAQKFFAKLEREQANGKKSCELPSDLTIPPPRPKRKPARPYPKKSDAGDGSGSGSMAATHLSGSIASPATTSVGHQTRSHHHLTPSPSPAPSLKAAYSGLPWMPPVAVQQPAPSGGAVGVAAVAAAASAAAAAAAAAVVATADEATQALLQADPPQGFPFYGMPPSALAHYATQMQASPHLQALSAHQAAKVYAVAAAGGPLLRPHARSPHAMAAAAAGQQAARVATTRQQQRQSAMEHTATSDPNVRSGGQQQSRTPRGHASLQDGSIQEGSDGDSACSRETSRQGGATAAGNAVATAAAASALQMARARSVHGPIGGQAAAAAAATAQLRSASMPPQWAGLPIEALLQAAAVSSGHAPDVGLQAPISSGRLLENAPMTHADLFKPTSSGGGGTAPDTSQRRAERADKLRTRRTMVTSSGNAGSGGGGGSNGNGSGDIVDNAANNGNGNGSSGGSGIGSYEGYNNSIGDNRNNGGQSAAPAGPARPSSNGTAGSNDSQDSLQKNGAFAAADNDSGEAEGYGSNPTGNGSSDGLVGNGNGSSVGDVGKKSPSKQNSPVKRDGNGTSKAPLPFQTGPNILDVELCAGNAHALAHAQAHPHAAEVAALQGRVPAMDLLGNNVGTFGAWTALQALTNPQKLAHPALAAAAQAAEIGRPGSGAGSDGSSLKRSSSSLAALGDGNGGGADTAARMAAAAAARGSGFGGLDPQATAVAAASALQQAGVNPYLLSAAAAACGNAAAGRQPTSAPSSLNPVATLNTSAGLPPALVASWATGLPGVQNPSGQAGAADLRTMLVPLLSPAAGASPSHAQQQAQSLLEQLQAQHAQQRNAAAQYQQPIDGAHPAPGQGEPKSAFEPVSQQTPPPAFRQPGPAKEAAAAANGNCNVSGGGSNNKGEAAMALDGCSVKDGACGGSDGSNSLPVRPKATRSAPSGQLPPGLPSGIDVGGSGAASTAAGGLEAGSSGGFQPYKGAASSDGGLTVSGGHKRSISSGNNMFDVPPRKRLYSAIETQPAK